MLEILDNFFGMSSDVQEFKVRIFANDFEFWIGVNEYKYKTFQIKFCSPYCYHLITFLLKVYIITHTKEKPFMTNWYFLENW